MNVTKRRASAGACVAAVALLAVPGAASAASRGFVIHNNTSQTFVLQNITSVPCAHDDAICRNSSDEQYPFEFEGHPPLLSKLPPGKSDRIELKYGATWGKNYSYAATVHYDGFSVFIGTRTTANDSVCHYNRKQFDCVASGLNITIRDADGRGK